MSSRERKPKTKTEAGGSTAKVPAQQSQVGASVEETVKPIGFRRCARWCIVTETVATSRQVGHCAISCNQNNGGLT